MSASLDDTVKEWDAGTGECLCTLKGHTDPVLSAVYNPAGDKIVSVSLFGTIKEWDAASGECIKTHQKANNFAMSEYHPKNMIDTKLPTDGNKINLHYSSQDKKKQTLSNIPGLWIQGCSFKNLEKNSQWSEQALKLMKQYGARF